MNFYSAIGVKRPVRLSEKTRTFAWESLQGRYGREAKQNPAVSMEEVPGFSDMSSLEQYEAGIRKIVLESPVRLCEGELISGAATLGGAIQHMVPAVFAGNYIFPGVSHLTADFPYVLEQGMNGVDERIHLALERHTQKDKRRFLQSMEHCMESLRIWHLRYMDALQEAAEKETHWQDNLNLLRRVPFYPAGNFREAVQSLWFMFAFLRLCGNWPGIGRLDQMLGKYLKDDLMSGSITLEEAREVLSHLFIKGCEWIGGGEELTGGDAQHYQNIVLSGVDEQGNDVTNEVTYLVLDIVEELGISDFPISVRVNAHTSPELLRRVAEVIRHGGGVVAVYGEETVLQAMTGMGYSLKEARSFANDGCWEVQIPGDTHFGYLPFDSLQILQNQTLCEYRPDGVTFLSFQELYDQYKKDLRLYVENMIREYLDAAGKVGADGVWQWHSHEPCTVISLLERSCVENGCSYREGGPRYRVISPHIGGLPDVVNSLYAIKKLIFEEKKLSFDSFMAILRQNWEGKEVLRQYVRSHYTYYGNDNDEVDQLAVRLLNDFADICDDLPDVAPIAFPAGVSTFGRQLEWSPFRRATPFGHRQGDILAANLSPTPGSDEKGATAVIRSYCKINLPRMASGAALDVNLLPSVAGGTHGVMAIQGLIRGFAALGGFFMQMDVTDPEVLREAQEHPDQYPTLAVRISGWSARFVTLDKEWQRMIMERDLQDRLS